MTGECTQCGSSRTIPVWEDPDDAHECTPDYVGCKDCSTMVRPHLLPDGETSYGQTRLTDREIACLRTGNQHSSELTVIEWQIVKAAARHYGVPDWTSYVDGTLTVNENVGLMEMYATRDGGITLREMKSPRFCGEG